MKCGDNILRHLVCSYSTPNAAAADRTNLMNVKVSIVMRKCRLPIRKANNLAMCFWRCIFSRQTWMIFKGRKMHNRTTTYTNTEKNNAKNHLVGIDFHRSFFFSSVELSSHSCAKMTFLLDWFTTSFLTRVSGLVANSEPICLIASFSGRL